MAYKYVNPGYGELLDSAGTTVNDTKINAANGVAFFNNSDDRSVTFPEPLTNVWIKLSMERAYVSGIISVSGTGWPTGVRLNESDYIRVFFSGDKKILPPSMQTRHRLISSCMFDPASMTASSRSG